MIIKLSFDADRTSSPAAPLRACGPAAVESYSARQRSVPSSSSCSSRAPGAYAGPSPSTKYLRQSLWNSTADAARVGAVRGGVARAARADPWVRGLPDPLPANYQKYYSLGTPVPTDDNIHQVRHNDQRSSPCPIYADGDRRHDAPQ